MTTATIPIRQKVTGMALGAAVGDALGAPFEFGPPGQYAKHFPTPRYGSHTEMIGGGSFNWKAGEFTDDTQMALTLTDSLLRNGHLNRHDIWTNWATWSTSAPDVGTTTARGLTGTSPGESAADHFNNGWRAAGNGAVMRTYPIALFGYGKHLELSAVMEMARTQALLTHGDPEASWVPAVVSGLLFGLLHDSTIDDALSHAMDNIPDNERQILVKAASPDHDPRTTMLSNGSAWGCFADALWSIRQTTSYTQAVTAAIDIGGDTDTVACVAGAIAGTMYGVQSIPARWTNTLNGWAITGQPQRSTRTEFLRNDITSAAYALAGLPDSKSTVSESSAGPTQVAPGLYAASLPGARTADKSFAVVSLCATGSAFQDFAQHREFFIIDDLGNVNPHLAEVVTEAVETIEEFRNEGFKVLVHCHGGRSRTGLILASWRKHTTGANPQPSCDWVENVWPRVSWWNTDFTTWFHK